MKKLLTSAAAILLITGASLAQEQPKAKAQTAKKEAAECKKDAKGNKSCCMQPSKTAALRAQVKKRPEPITISPSTRSNN